MSSEFEYKPRFKDMRIKPPRPEEEAAKADVLHLKPGEKACNWPDCRQAATARAPKSRERLNDFYDFCQRHAGEYNKGWNFYAGMGTAGKAGPGNMQDSFGLFGRRTREQTGPAGEDALRLGKLERAALADLGLDARSDRKAIKARYHEMLKRFHPDMNQGDRGAEAKLQSVIKAYKTLKKAGLAA